MNNSKKFDSAYYQEWSFIQGRKFLLSILALGSVLITHKIGSHIAFNLSPNQKSIQFFITSFFIFLGYMGIDWVLANALSSASNVQKKKEQKGNKSIWTFALAALTTTLLLSLVSNFFISSEIAGETPLNYFNEQIEKARVQDSVLKVNAYEMLNKAAKDQNNLIREAKKEKNIIVAKAINSGSSSWKSDYDKHKNNPKAWFWTCTKCPSEYKAYRKRIKDAILEGDGLIAKATNHQSFIQSSLSPTLSYQLSSDSMLIAVKENTQLQEQQRQFRERQLNIILFAMTFGAGILALILTIVIKKHRENYGQQIEENNALILMIFFDMISRLSHGLADIIYTVIAEPFNRLKKNGWIKSYTLMTESQEVSTDKEQISENNGSVLAVKRNCQNCNTDISHKRSDAKFCSDKCRMDYHDYIPRKKQNGVL